MKISELVSVLRRKYSNNFDDVVASDFKSGQHGLNLALVLRIIDEYGYEISSVWEEYDPDLDVACILSELTDIVDIDIIKYNLPALAIESYTASRLSTLFESALVAFTRSPEFFDIRTECEYKKSKYSPGLSYASNELKILCDKYNNDGDEAIIKEFVPEILVLLEKFYRSDQSGSSVPIVAKHLSEVIYKLCLQEPITEILDVPEQWFCYSDTTNKMYQHRRCGGLFRDTDGGIPYYLDSIIWHDVTTGNTWVGGSDICGVDGILSVHTFPFIPKSFTIDLERKEALHDLDERPDVRYGDDGFAYVYEIKNMAQVKAALEYYS
jgi:hypothetical protein